MKQKANKICAVNQNHTIKKNILCLLSIHFIDSSALQIEVYD